jgi:hypothetical protein
MRQPHFVLHTMQCYVITYHKNIYHATEIDKKFHYNLRFNCKTLCEWHLVTTFRGWNPPSRRWIKADPTEKFFKMRIADKPMASSISSCIK